MKLLLIAIMLWTVASELKGGAFDDNFDIMWADDHFKTSDDGRIWHLSLDKLTGCGFQTKQRYRFGWFSMKVKLVGGDSAGVVTAYYVTNSLSASPNMFIISLWITSCLNRFCRLMQMCSENGAGPERDEIDFEFLGNRSGQPYTIQTNVYKNGTGGREMRHQLWFDPTEDYHSYSVIHGRFFVDKVPIRVFKNNGRANNFFPNEKPMYLFSSIWNADDWATRGGLEKTDWNNAPFVSSYKDFSVDGCRWEDPYPACVSTTTENWWDKYDAWHLSFECSLSPWS